MYLLKSEGEEKQLQKHAQTRSLREKQILASSSFSISSLSNSVMEKKHRCKLCFRNFANGRALGGHMRSHMMKFYAEEKASKLQNGQGFAHDFRSYSLPSSSSEEDEEEEEEEEEYDEEEEEDEREAVVRGASSYELRENPKKSAVLLDHYFPSVVVQGGESETESSEKNTAAVSRRRSKRVRESRFSDDFDVFKVQKRAKFFDDGGAVYDQSSPVSSISDTTPEEHVALCLIMLSKDKWEKKEEGDYEDEEEEEESKKFEDDDDIFEAAKMAKTHKSRGKYRCEECNKLFRSYQALGGHRASHKKIKVNTAPPPPPPPKKAEAKIHQCPFCERIFSSGQALGGHKRSHFIGAGAISTNYHNSIDRTSRISQAFSIDLNLPAPVEEEESSQVAISAVSDAEFVHPIKE